MGYRPFSGGHCPWNPSPGLSEVQTRTRGSLKLIAQKGPETKPEREHPQTGAQLSAGGDEHPRIPGTLEQRLEKG